MGVLLVQDGCVYTADDENHVVPKGAVLVVDGVITAVGTAAEVGAALPVGRMAELTVLDAGGMLVLPGFVNAHWHETFAMRLTRHNALRPVSDRHDANGFLSGGGDLYAVSASFDSSADFGALLTPGEAEAVARYSMWTQLRSGVTTLGDSGSVNRSEALAAAARSLGMRCAVSTWASDVMCTPESAIPVRTKAADSVLAAIEEVAVQSEVDSTGLVRCRPSAIYVTNMSDELGLGLAELTERHDLPFATHVGALRHEATVMRRHHRTTGVRRLADLGLLTDRLMAVHCAFVDDEERAMLVDAGAQVNLSPAKYGTTGETLLAETSTVPALRRAGLDVSLSTDGLPMPLPGMVEAMRSAWQGFGERSGDPASLLPTDTLAMATRVPARGLRWDDEIGSLAPGKRADLVLVPADDWRFLLQPRPLESLLMLGSSKDVDTVVVGGEILVSGGRGTRADERELCDDYLSALESFSSRCLGVEAGPQLGSARRRPREGHPPRLWPARSAG